MSATTNPIPKAKLEVVKNFTTINAFSIENFKAIDNLSAVLDGGSAIFHSKQNGGKTTATFHAIQTLIGNFNGSKLREGAEEGSLVYDLSHPKLGNVIVMLELGKREKLTVTYEDGKPVTGKTATDFIKSISSDAHKNDISDLLGKSGKALVEELVKQLGIEFEAEELAYKEAFENRKNLKRDLDGQRSRLGMPPTEMLRELAAKEETNTVELSKKIQEATQHNSKIDGLKADVERFKKTFDDIDKEEEEVNAEMKKLEEKLEKISQRREKGSEMLSQKKEELSKLFPVKIESMHEKMAKADERNQSIREAKSKVENFDKENKEFQTLEKAYEEAHAEVKETRSEMYDKINKHPHGIDGLKVIASGIETSNRTTVSINYKGRDFSTDEIAEGEMWAIALKLKASQLKEGELGFFKIQGNLLDNESFLDLVKYAEGMGIQIAGEFNTQMNEKVQVETDFETFLAKRL